MNSEKLDMLNHINRLSLTQILKEIRVKSLKLLRKEIDLVKTELKADIKSEIFMVGGMGIAAVLIFLSISMLLVTLILALSEVLPSWAAGLIVSAVLLLTAAIVAFISWKKRVKNPLRRTREVLETDLKMKRGSLA